MDKQTILDAINYIGIDPKDFNLKDSYFTSDSFAHHRHHGKGHIYRVMIGTALIAKELQEPWLGKLAFCAAFLHDQARKNNGGDYNHGLRAAKNKFTDYAELWKKYELSHYECEYIRAACADHASCDDHNFKKNGEVRKILKDADALDRCRFHVHSKLDPSMLAFQKESRKLIKSIEEICAPTNHGFTHDITFLQFIDAATQPKTSVKIYNRDYAPETILTLESDQIFVFNNNSTGDSNFATAIAARRYHNAQKGVAEGLSGETYSIPTDGGSTLEIQKHVDKFISFAKANPQFEFLVTKIGCGAAGYSEDQIAPLFKKAISVQNIILPKGFVDIIEK